MTTDEKYYNMSKKDVFGVRRPTNQEDIEPLGWKVIDPNLDTAFAEITTVTAIMQGVVTYDFMQHAELVPRPFVDIGIRMALREGWLTELAEGEFSPLYPPGHLIELANLGEESQSSVHEVAAEICFDLIESVMVDNPMRVFAKQNALIGLGGPCTAKTWPAVERMLAAHPAVLVGGVRESSPTRNRNFYRSIIEGEGVRHRDFY